MNNAKNFPQLGDLMITSRLLSEEQLDLGLMGAKETGLPLGLQLILQNAIDFDTLQSIVAAQSLVRDELVTREVAANALSLSKRKAIAINLALDLLGVQVDNSMKNRLGTLLIDGAIVDRALLKSRLKISKATGLPLGKVFVSAGDLGVEIVDKAVSVQRLIRIGEILREEGIDSILSVRSCLDSVAKIEQDVVHMHSRLGKILIDSGLITEENLRAAVEEGERRNLKLGDAVVQLHWISPESVDIAVEIQRLIREKKFSYQHGISMLRRIHAIDIFPCDEESMNTKPESTALSFLQFLRLARLVDSFGRNILSQGGVYRSHGFANLIEETWTVLPGLIEEDRHFSDVIPKDVSECLSENGFATPEQQLSVARAAREYKLHRDKVLTIEQALVKYHAAIIDGTVIAPWSGTFPAISAWKGRETS